MRIYPISFEQMKKKGTLFNNSYNSSPVSALLLLNPQIKIDSLHLKPVFIIYLILKYYDKKS